MWHATCKQGNCVDSRLLVVRSQTANLIPGFLLTITCVSDVQMGHANPFQTSKFQELFNDIKTVSIQWVLTPVMLSKNLGVHSDSNSQSGNSLGSVRVHSLTFFCILRAMKCDSQASFLARTLTSPYLGREPKVRVATLPTTYLRTYLLTHPPTHSLTIHLFIYSLIYPPTYSPTYYLHYVNVCQSIIYTLWKYCIKWTKNHFNHIWPCCQ
jgi:hypothetical protein